ncbi:MAG: NACHT domain-containing NTPase [Cyanobacteria bacterium P01_F01_bin.150]
MAVRSLTATPEGVDQINRALTEKEWSRDDLAKHCDCSRQPAVKFCSGKAVSKKLFVSFCKKLDLDWESIATPTTTPQLQNSLTPQPQNSLTPQPQNSPTPQLLNLTPLVQKIRQKIHADIHHRCGTMRVLDMTQPIGVGDIYTSVNILEKISGRQRLGIKDLWEGCDGENFDRLLLGRVQQKRIPGLEAVERHSKLMILGKPGAGKTTFMKRLATQCNQGEFLADHIPVFITLKEFAEAEGKPSVQNYIADQWQTSGVEDRTLAGAMLKAGRAIILLDGLDEVLETEHNRVLKAIKDATRQFRDCQFVITCRIAAREYTFEHFTEVEVADFDQEQIAEFATKWFKAKNDPKKAETFIQRLKDNKPIQELATNPLLLTLLCLVFGDGGDFPPNRAELYKEGLDILLKKWDAKRNIERDQVYKKLSLKRKEDLLSQLAFNTFTAGEYFFKQGRVERQIIDYIRNLPGANEDEEALQLDSEAVLKSIESQHGLLVERARGIYSFSHLTFQEYFTAKQITSPTAQLVENLAALASHITENRYRETLFLAMGMLPEADALLRHIKRTVDGLIADDPTLQKILAWVRDKASEINAPYKRPAVRAFYFSLSLSLDRAFSNDFAFAFILNYVLNYDLDRDLDRDLDDNLALALVFALDRDLASDLITKSKLSNSELSLKLKCLKTKLPSTENHEALVQWWETAVLDWAERLRAVKIEHRSIGHDWLLTQIQKKQVHRYYQANLLLVKFLNSDCYVTKETRREIEDTLLLPTKEF